MNAVMYAVMYDWRGGAKNLPEWFIHQETIKISWEMIQELYDTGNNVMLRHSDDGMIVLVDNGGFTR
jgi:hypothetical protein